MGSEAAGLRKKVAEAAHMGADQAEENIEMMKNHRFWIVRHILIIFLIKLLEVKKTKNTGGVITKCYSVIFLRYIRYENRKKLGNTGVTAILQERKARKIIKEILQFITQSNWTFWSSTKKYVQLPIIGGFSAFFAKHNRKKQLNIFFVWKGNKLPKKQKKIKLFQSLHFVLKETIFDLLIFAWVLDSSSQVSRLDHQHQVPGRA